MPCKNCDFLTTKIKEMHEELVERNAKIVRLEQEIFKLNNQIFVAQEQKNKILQELGNPEHIQKIIVMKSNIKDKKKESE